MSICLFFIAYRRLKKKQPSYKSVQEGSENGTLHLGPFSFWIVYTILYSKKDMSQKLICSYSLVKGWQSTSNRKSILIDREANEAYASGPLTCMGPFQGPERGSSNALEMP
jgi:hypothetical protein